MNLLVSKVLSALAVTTPLTSASTNPPASIQPTPAFAAACYGQSKPTARCSSLAIAAINSARAGEGLGPITLPSNYSKLSTDAKLAAVTNAERTARGLSKLPQKVIWNNLAQEGASSGSDPSGPSGRAWGSIWAQVSDPLAADFLWMYDDGPNSPNVDCQQAGDPGCWGHRDNILGPSWTSMGSGSAGASVAELFVR